MAYALYLVVSEDNVELGDALKALAGVDFTRPTRPLVKLDDHGRRCWMTKASRCWSR